MNELSNGKILDLIINLKNQKYVFSGIKAGYKKRLAVLERSWQENLKTAENPEAMKEELAVVVKLFNLYSKEPKRTWELLMHTMTFGGLGFFDKFITDLLQSSRIGASIALHNLLVSGKFKDRGLNWGNWLKFNDVGEKIVEISNHLEDGLRWRRVQVGLHNLLKSFEGSELFHCLRKDAVMIEKQKNLFLSGQIQVGEDWRRRFFPKFRAGLCYLAEKKRAPVLTDYQYTLFCAAHAVLKNAYQKAVTEKFKVRLWKRDPRFDLWQGNDSECCIAIGGRPAMRLPGVVYNNYPAGILEYLIDQGIQVAQVESGKSIVGQCWLFLGTGAGNEPFLIADSFDLNGKYSGLSTNHQRETNQAIRSCMFDFLKRYAETVGIKKIYLGKRGPWFETGVCHTISNAVKTEDLAVRTLEKPIEKLGGYWLDQPYFLESVGGTEVFVIKE